MSDEKTIFEFKWRKSFFTKTLHKKYIDLCDLNKKNDLYAYLEKLFLSQFFKKTYERKNSSNAIYNYLYRDLMYPLSRTADIKKNKYI